MLRFRRMHSLQKFAAVHASVHNHFNADRSLSSRPNYKLTRAAALAEWRASARPRERAPAELRRVRIRLTAPAAGVERRVVDGEHRAGQMPDHRPVRPRIRRAHS